MSTAVRLLLLVLAVHFALLNARSFKKGFLVTLSGSQAVKGGDDVEVIQSLLDKEQDDHIIRGVLSDEKPGEDEKIIHGVVSHAEPDVGTYAGVSEGAYDRQDEDVEFLEEDAVSEDKVKEPVARKLVQDGDEDFEFVDDIITKGPEMPVRDQLRDKSGVSLDEDMEIIRKVVIDDKVKGTSARDQLRGASGIPVEESKDQEQSSETNEFEPEEEETEVIDNLTRPQKVEEATDGEDDTKIVERNTDDADVAVIQSMLENRAQAEDKEILKSLLVNKASTIVASPTIAKANTDEQVRNTQIQTVVKPRVRDQLRGRSGISVETLPRVANEDAEFVKNLVVNDLPEDEIRDQLRDRSGIRVNKAQSNVDEEANIIQNVVVNDKLPVKNTDAKTKPATVTEPSVRDQLRGRSGISVKKLPSTADEEAEIIQNVVVNDKPASVTESSVRDQLRGRSGISVEKLPSTADEEADIIQNVVVNDKPVTANTVAGPVPSVRDQLRGRSGVSVEKVAEQEIIKNFVVNDKPAIVTTVTKTAIAVPSVRDQLRGRSGISVEKLPSAADEEADIIQNVVVNDKPASVTEPSVRDQLRSRSGIQVNKLPEPVVVNEEEVNIEKVLAGQTPEFTEPSVRNLLRGRSGTPVDKQPESFPVIESNERKEIIKNAIVNDKPVLVVVPTKTIEPLNIGEVSKEHEQLVGELIEEKEIVDSVALNEFKQHIVPSIREKVRGRNGIFAGQIQTQPKPSVSEEKEIIQSILVNQEAASPLSVDQIETTTTTANPTRIHAWMQDPSHRVQPGNIAGDFRLLQSFRDRSASRNANQQTTVQTPVEEQVNVEEELPVVPVQSTETIEEIPTTTQKPAVVLPEEEPAVPVITRTTTPSLRDRIKGSGIPRSRSRNRNSFLKAINGRLSDEMSILQNLMSQQDAQPAISLPMWIEITDSKHQPGNVESDIRLMDSIRREKETTTTTSTPPLTTTEEPFVEETTTMIEWEFIEEEPSTTEPPVETTTTTKKLTGRQREKLRGRSGIPAVQVQEAPVNVLLIDHLVRQTVLNASATTGTPPATTTGFRREPHCLGYRISENIPHPEDSKKFIICQGGPTDYMIMNCPATLVFNTFMHRCDRTQNEPPKACLSSPCRHDGKCIDTETYGFKCQCLEGFSGETCEKLSNDPCFANPCSPNGICTSLESFKLPSIKHFCLCNGGNRYGKNCDDNNSTFVNPCLIYHTESYYDAELSQSLFIHCENDIMNVKSCPATLIWAQKYLTCMTQAEIEAKAKAEQEAADEDYEFVDDLETHPHVDPQEEQQKQEPELEEELPVATM